jgi:WD40 repeat protein
MRIIEACNAAICTVAVSPDGRHVAASGQDGWYAVYDWVGGEAVRRLPLGAACDQFAFDAGNWVGYVHHRELRLDRLEAAPVPAQPEGAFAGGVAVSPDGRRLVATKDGPGGLACWELPTLRPQTGFDGWPPFRRLIFSPNGDYLAGIWPGARRGWRTDPAAFEIRFARSGGRDFHYPPLKGGTYSATGFVSFTRDSGTCAFGWENEFFALDTSTGTSRDLRRVEAPFRDAAFTGSGRHLATVDGDGVLKLWDAKAWRVAREYDWGCGPLTCVAFTADGLAGVCGTADGRLVQFDVDE